MAIGIPPVTTPYRRVRIRRFRGLSYRPPVNLGISERVEVRDGQGDIEARLCAEKSEDSRPGPLLLFALQSNAAGLAHAALDRTSWRLRL